MKVVELKGKVDADNYPQMPQTGEQYPWGLKLMFNDDVLEALGIDDLPATGATVMIEARAIVEEVRDPVGSMLDGRSLCVQIVAIGLDIQKKTKTPGRKVYGDDDA